MMYEPFYWSKGINDYLNNKKYACYSSYPEDEMPPITDADLTTEILLAWREERLPAEEEAFIKEMEFEED